MLLWYRNVFSNTTIQNRFCECNGTLSIPPNEGVAQGITHSRGQKDSAHGREQFERRISAFSFQDPASRITAYKCIFFYPAKLDLSCLCGILSGSIRGWMPFSRCVSVSRFAFPAPWITNHQKKTCSIYVISPS